MKRHQRYDKGKESTKILRGFECAFECGAFECRGSKLMNLYGAFECAFHIFACIAQVLNFNIHACVVYASYRLE